jgi:hypothetical protein
VRELRQANEILLTPMPPGGLIRRGCPREPGGMQR